MGDSSRCAQLVVTELLGAGVQEVVLSPGSRSAPLAYELLEADKIGLLRLHVRIDERTAGFLALGLAKASERPVAVVTTSGTAAANLHPAVLEAFHSHIPLVAMTADRPRAVSARRRASAEESAIGFSHKTCLPASSALTDQGTCRWLGKGL